MLHEFAREVKGVEKKLGNKFNTAQYVAIYRPWEVASGPSGDQGTIILWSFWPN
jgi:hypothetical protein